MEERDYVVRVGSNYVFMFFEGIFKYGNLIFLKFELVEGLVIERNFFSGKIIKDERIIFNGRFLKDEDVGFFDRLSKISSQFLNVL